MFQAMLLVCAIGNGCQEMIDPTLHGTVEQCQARLTLTIKQVREQFAPEHRERVAFARKCVALPSA